MRYICFTWHQSGYFFGKIIRKTPHKDQRYNRQTDELQSKWHASSRIPFRIYSVWQNGILFYLNLFYYLSKDRMRSKKAHS